MRPLKQPIKWNVQTQNPQGMHETAAIAKRVTRARLMCEPLCGNIDSRQQIRPKPNSLAAKKAWVQKCFGMSYPRLKPALTVTLEDAAAAPAHSRKQKNKQNETFQLELLPQQ